MRRGVPPVEEFVPARVPEQAPPRERVHRNHRARACEQCGGDVRGARCVFCVPVELPFIGGLP